MGSTVAAISTGQAPGGIGVIRVSGPEAIRICDNVFCSKFSRRLADMSGYTAALGEIQSRDGSVLDECVAVVFRGPRSYTGEDVVELSCHGGLYVTRQVLAEIISHGAVPAGPGEFTRRAFLNGKMDLAQAESVMETISARGRHAMLAAQAAGSGELSKRIGAISAKLERQASHLAAWADFPEEDVDIVNNEDVRTCLNLCDRELCGLLKSFDRGRIFREGIRTVIAGRPNVGKSTLMNMLAGRERSIVTPYAGTTRDVIEEHVSLADVPLLLADTAGLRETDDPVERIGVESARQYMKNAELVLAVFDWSAELKDEDLAMARSVCGVPVIAVVNKCDLEQKIDLEFIKNNFKYCAMVSAAQGDGMDRLEKAFTEMIGAENFDTGQAELFTDRQRSAALTAKAAVEQGIEALDNGLTLDAVTVCVEDALSALYQLTGKKVSDKIVEQVFERFCVGK